jgi:hypothetical protein
MLRPMQPAKRLACGDFGLLDYLSPMEFEARAMLA